MILYTADLHFGHNNIIKYDSRPFKDADDMDHVLIELWNGKYSQMIQFISSVISVSSPDVPPTGILNS